MNRKCYWIDTNIVMSLFGDIRNIKGDIFIILKLTMRAKALFIKGQINIPSWQKMTRKDKTKGQKGSRRVTTARIKGEETLSFGMLDLLFRFSVFSCESFQKASAFSQCEDVAPRASRQWTKTHCQGRYHFRCLSCAYRFFSLVFQSDCRTMFKIRFVVAGYCIAGCFRSYLEVAGLWSC